MTRDIPGFTRDKQWRAADPDVSAWVSANAGSGKTHVLTQRVVRLLLAGVAPSKILCLTFTKAAAANMSMRVFRTLAEWTTLEDAALAAAIENVGAQRPGPERMLFARRLFARTIETPGGLKIQTIHAFCEAVLHRFPFEANVPARFEALDDERQRELLAQARAQTLSEAIGDEDGALGSSLRVLTAETSAAAFDALLQEALTSRARLSAAIEGDPSGEAFGRRLGALFGLPPNASVEAIERSMVEDGLSRAQWASVAELLEQGSVNDRKAAALLRETAALSPDAACLEPYLRVFLTSKNERRANLVTATVQKRAPGLLALLEAERERLCALLEQRKAAAAVARTRALLVLVGSIFTRYQALKSRRGWLDFDDLIEQAARLLRRADAAWVLYKLDAGIDHILVDEAQDTSEPQWSILRALADEFTAGAGARGAGRTIFAVGDEKQSIYSFQGAAPHLFDAMRRSFSERHRGADKDFEEIALTMSFRSSSGILDSVDAIFAIPDHARGLSARSGPIDPHEPWKADLPGLVELWEPIRPNPRVDPRDWRLPVDCKTSADPEVALADRLARRIECWLAPGSGEIVHDKGPRAVRHGDILILVRTRGPLFEAIIRALKERGVPVAGADRLILTEHIAVMDLIAAGRAALLPDDDLTLACVLKSPLIGLDDDDLIMLAPTRPGALWRALEASAEARHREAFARLSHWRRQAATRTPFAFYAHLLGADGGRRRMLARLGPEATDAIDEFVALALDHDRENAPSLTNFLHGLENARVCVKRDMDAAGDCVRVMTAHAAKGLEAKIVILPDTCGAASGRHDPRIFFLDSPRGPLPVYSPRRECDPPALAPARAQARLDQEAEHHRLLYVALTRAEERLYVAGFEGQRGRGQGCWYTMIHAALGPHFSESAAPWDPAERIYRVTHEWPPRLPALREEIPQEPSAASPNWLTRPAPKERAPEPPLRPSSALASADQIERASSPLSRRSAKDAARIGSLAHTLLQYLPSSPASSRADAAELYLRARASYLSVDERRDLAARVLAVIEDPRLAPLFGPRSRAEAAICGSVVLPNGASAQIAGTIDRLAETETDIYIADFKTGKFDPAKGPPDAYVAQLALYRAAVAPLWNNRPVRAWLVWTNGPHIYAPTPEEFESALRNIGR
ncbi:MAG TPA: double-strand break repair helicase AddA [Beijerinckiaceae bacterium]|nr:double-strand break repair helicase AddA [Beijerinckiaceae bacterium]